MLYKHVYFAQRIDIIHHMRTLEKKEGIAVAVAIFVIGFFFVFGPGLISIFNSSQSNITMNQTQLGIKDVIVGVGDEAVTGSRVVVHYTGRFPDGKIFDSSLNRGEPFQFVLGNGQVIEGWDKGIVGMRVGGKRILTVPPELGYGSADYGPIPGGSTLIFEVDLLRVDK
jgi:peptidylprolyl isomerase/FKBP-type peptidyl-prolyl cis-trans isomerase FkpA